MRKEIAKRNGRKLFLLGEGKDGRKYWLEEGKWECDWYWSFGNINTYTHSSPEIAQDIWGTVSFDMLFSSSKNCFDHFKDFFFETPLSDDEIWKLLELMKTFYTLKTAAEVMTRGGSNITKNPVGLVKDVAGAKKLNAIVLPPIMYEVYQLLTPEYLK